MEKDSHLRKYTLMGYDTVYPLLAVLEQIYYNSRDIIVDYDDLEYICGVVLRTIHQNAFLEWDEFDINEYDAEQIMEAGFEVLNKVINIMGYTPAYSSTGYYVDLHRHLFLIREEIPCPTC